MNIDPEILDESWIYNFKNEESEYNDFYKEKPTSVKLYFMYINREKIIDIIKTEHFLLNDKAKIEKEDLISIIKKYQVCYNTKYKLLSLLKFNIDLEPNDVISNTFMTLSDTTTQTDIKYMTTEHYIEDIHFKDTVCIFHDINSLIFIFYERNHYNTINHNPTNTTKKVVFNTNRRKTVKKRV